VLVLELDAAKFAGGAVDENQPANIRTACVVPRRKRQHDLRAGRVVADVGVACDAVQPRESVRQEHVLIGRKEVLGAVIVDVDVPVSLELQRHRGIEWALTRRAGGRHIRALRLAHGRQRALESCGDRRDEPLIARQGARLERGANFGPRRERTRGRTLRLAGARLISNHANRAQRDAVRGHDDVDGCTRVGTPGEGPDRRGREADSADEKANGIDSRELQRGNSPAGRQDRRSRRASLIEFGNEDTRERLVRFGVDQAHAHRLRARRRRRRVQQHSRCECHRARPQTGHGLEARSLRSHITSVGVDPPHPRAFRLFDQSLFGGKYSTISIWSE
jgi:hypothetical protein